MHGGQWEEYISLCPGTPRDLAAQALGLEESDLPELQQDQNALLRIKGSEVKAEVHPAETFLMCSGSRAPLYRLTEDTVTVDRVEVPGYTWRISTSTAEELPANTE